MFRLLLPGLVVLSSLGLAHGINKQGKTTRLTRGIILSIPSEAIVETAFQGLLVTRAGEWIWQTKDSEAFSQTRYRVPRKLAEWEHEEDKRVIVKSNSVTFRSIDYSRDKAKIEVRW